MLYRCMGLEVVENMVDLVSPSIRSRHGLFVVFESQRSCYCLFYVLRYLTGANVVALCDPEHYVGSVRACHLFHVGGRVVVFVLEWASNMSR